MPAPSKLPKEHWDDARSRWESDPRKGYAWLVADLGLPVTGVAVRKRAVREGWSKKVLPGVSRSKSSEPRSCCGCCGNYGQVDKSLCCRGRIPQSEIMERLAGALLTVADCIMAPGEKPCTEKP